MDKIIEIMRKKIKKGMILELTSKIEDPYSPKEKGSRFMASILMMPVKFMGNGQMAVP